MNVRVDLQETIRDGMEVVFKAPCNASVVTGLNVYYPVDGVVESQSFAFADANANDVGHIDTLFAEGAVVKVIIDLDTNMAFVQNADTNAYLEGRLAAIEYYHTTREEVGAEHNDITSAYIWGLYDALMEAYPDNVHKNPVHNDDGTFTNYEYVISTGDYSTEGQFAQLYGANTDAKKPKYIVLSGYHGIERNGALSVYRFIRDVLNGHNVPQAFKEGVIISILPVGNPGSFDAYTYVSGAFKNGSAEGQAIKNWMSTNADADLYIDMHNGSALNEIVAVLGNADNEAVNTAQRIALKGVDRIIPYWKDVIGYPSEVEVITSYTKDKNTGIFSDIELGYKPVIFSYCANAHDETSTYATNELSITGICLEVADYHGNYSEYNPTLTIPQTTGAYQPEAIAAGAEIIGNVLLEFYEQSFMGEVVEDMKVIDSKLDTLLAQVNRGFRIVPGTQYRLNSGGTQIYFPLSEQPKMLIWRATTDTQNRVLSIANAGADTTKYFTIGGIINFATDFDVVSKAASANQNSTAFSLVYYKASYGAIPAAKECAQAYANGEVISGVFNMVSVFDNGDGTTTPAEYEWTAYYWND